MDVLEQQPRRSLVFTFLTPRRMTLSTMSLISCSLKSLWCSKVCSAFTLTSELKWRGGLSPAKGKECHICSTTENKVWHGQRWLRAVRAAHIARHFFLFILVRWFNCNNVHPVLEENGLFHLKKWHQRAGLVTNEYLDLLPCDLRGWDQCETCQSGLMESQTPNQCGGQTLTTRCHTRLSLPLGL